MIETLATYRRCCTRMESAWPAYLERRQSRLMEAQRFGSVSEKTAENIIEDLLTSVLDWALGDVNHQVEYADLLLTRLGIKYLVIEAKRPGALTRAAAVDDAVEQAWGYADKQRVHGIMVSDGVVLAAFDIIHGGLRPRARVSLDTPQPHPDLWWLSVHGIYRTPARLGSADAPVALVVSSTSATPAAPLLLHPKYHLPCSCFAFVGDASNARTWKLPYLLADGTVDIRRLPKAVQAVLTNYRGAQVLTIPESAIPDVLVRLGRAALVSHRLAVQAGPTTAIYGELETALEQLDRLADLASS